MTGRIAPLAPITPGPPHRIPINVLGRLHGDSTISMMAVRGEDPTVASDLLRRSTLLFNRACFLWET